MVSNVLVIIAEYINISASAGAVIVLGQTAGKSLFSLLHGLRLLIIVLLSAVVMLIHWPYSAQGLEYCLWSSHRVFF